MKWVAALPRARPPVGMCSQVFAMKSASGARHEYVGLITEEQAAAVWKILLPPAPAQQK